MAWRRRNRPAVASAFPGPASVSSGARSSANRPGAVVAATARSASVQAHAGGALSTSRQRPAATSHPARSGRLPRCSSSVDLPSPASPVTRVTRKPSVTACAAAATSAESCASRPTNGTGSGGGARRWRCRGTIAQDVGALGEDRLFQRREVRAGVEPEFFGEDAAARRRAASACCSTAPGRAAAGPPRGGARRGVSRSASGTIAAGRRGADLPRRAARRRSVAARSAGPSRRR